jgi:hypothetical protein
MADIDSIIAGSGGGTRADFSGIADIPKYYYEGRDQKFKQEGRDLFKAGIPKNADGTINYSAMRDALFQHGDVGQGTALDNLDVQRQQLRLGQEMAAGMGRLEGAAPTQQPAIVSPPSANRTASATVAPPLAKGGVPAGSGSGPQGGTTVMQVLAAQGIPNDQLGAASASVARQLGIENPNAPIDVNDPQVRNVLVPAVQQLKRMGIGQVAQPGQPQVQEIPPVNPQQNQGTFGAPAATPTRGAVPTGNDPEIQKQIATYTAIASNPAYPKSVQEAAMTRLKALQESGAPTGPMKEYDLYRRQGGDLKFNDWLADNESKKTAATEEAKMGAKKYEGLIEAGTKAQIEIPQLELMQEQMNDPNFFSGSGEKYNLAYKRLKSAIGIDPEAPVPQEMLRKVTSANILSGLGALKGLGQIRVAEINLAKDAAASPDNSIPANKFLIETSKRMHQRSAEIAEKAQEYKEKNGTLDAGFDKQVTSYYKQNPLYNDAEIKDWHKIIGEAKKPTSSAQQSFSSPADVHAAVASGKLKKGDTFTDPNGVKRIVP